MQPKEQMTKAIGTQAAEGAMKVKARLEKLAEDIDIFVTAKKGSSNSFNELQIELSKLKNTPSDRYVSGLDTPVKNYVLPENFGIYAKQGVAKELVTKAEFLKNLFVKNQFELVETQKPKGFINKIKSIFKTNKAQTETVKKAVTPAEMINPDASLNSPTARFLRYICEHRKGNIQDIKKALDVDDNFINSQKILGHIEEIAAPHTKSYVITPTVANRTLIYNTIKPKYFEQFEKEIKGLYFRHHISSLDK